MVEFRPSPLTVPASWLFSLASDSYHRACDAGVFRVDRLPGAVLSVGNLAVGGTGKTPAVLALARAGLGAGTRPAVLTRGHGGTRKGVLRAGSWSSGDAASAEEAGDEALLLSRALPGVPVVVERRRAAGARALLASGETVDLWLLDDGFQHRRLARDADLVLLDGRLPLGNGRRLPAGPLRESVFALRRAHGLLLTGLEPGEGIPEDTARLLGEHAPGKPVWRSWTVFEGFSTMDGRDPGGDDNLRGRPALAVSGIARPERFHALLASLGLGSAGRRVFADHHRFTWAEVREIEAEARRRDAVPVTTAKDAVRLENLADPASGWRVARVRTEAETDWEVILGVLLRGGVDPPATASGLAGASDLR